MRKNDNNKGSFDVDDDVVSITTRQTRLNYHEILYMDHENVFCSLYLVFAITKWSSIITISSFKR